MPDFKHSNGDRVESVTTGLTGIITFSAYHLHGCNRYYVQPPVGDDNKVPDGYWFDEDDLTVTEPQAVTGTDSPRGGPISRIR